MLFRSGLLGILFFCWSGDQFWSAFTYREKEEVVVSTADGFNASSRSNEQAEPATYAAWIVTLFIGILGIVNWPQGVSVPKDATSSLRLHLLFSQADPSFQDLSIAPAIKSPESFTPIFRQTALWPQEEWEIREVEGGQPLGKLRIDGLWLKPVDADWLWRWYGWKTKLLDAEGSRKIWSLSRTIGEEGMVVNDWLPISGSDGPKLMISLIGESVRPLGEKDQTRLLKLFDRLRERIESVIAAN